MGRATFRFYAELNHFLPAERRQREVRCAFDGGPAIKDLIEGLGVPHTEVDLILAGGESVDFSYIVRDGDRISVYPVFESLDISSLVRVRPRPLRRPRFILDAHLGRLARYMRMAGFDASYDRDLGGAELARISSDEERILLTRDRETLKRRIVTHGYWLRETEPRRQLIEVVRRFDLTALLTPFERCMRCNTPLARADKASIAGRVPPRVLDRHEEFFACGDCGRLYWPGSHHARMTGLLEEVRVTLGALISARSSDRAPVEDRGYGDREAGQDLEG